MCQYEHEKDISFSSLLVLFSNKEQKKNVGSQNEVIMILLISKLQLKYLFCMWTKQEVAKCARKDCMSIKTDVLKITSNIGV